jgi:hypothetical protein
MKGAGKGCSLAAAAAATPTAPRELTNSTKAAPPSFRSSWPLVRVLRG